MQILRLFFLVSVMPTALQAAAPLVFLECGLEQFYRLELTDGDKDYVEEILKVIQVDPAANYTEDALQKSGKTAPVFWGFSSFLDHAVELRDATAYVGFVLEAEIRSFSDGKGTCSKIPQPAVRSACTMVEEFKKKAEKESLPEKQYREKVYHMLYPLFGKEDQKIIDNLRLKIQGWLEASFKKK